MSVAGQFSDLQRDVLIEYAASGPKSFLPFSREWLGNLFFEKPNVLPEGKAVETLRSWGDDSAKHFRLMAAMLSKSTNVVRSMKQDWKNLGFRERRWLVYSATILPPPERTAFFKEVEEGGDPVERSVVAWIRGGRG